VSDYCVEVLDEYISPVSRYDRVFIPPPKEGGYVSTSVCLSVCLSVCMFISPLDYSEVLGFCGGRVQNLLASISPNFIMPTSP